MWRLGNPKSDGGAQQAEDSGPKLDQVLVQRQSADKPRRADVAEEVQRQSTGILPSCSGEISFLFYHQFSTDWMKPIHIMEGNHLYLSLLI